MPRTRLLIVVALLVAVAVAVTAAIARRSPAAANTNQVRLAVLIVFDQLRGDYLERWNDLYGTDGFRRFQEQGAWFTHCHYPYATTSTGPGHASVLSGTSPDRHGIINNEWYDRHSAADVYCAGSQRYEFVPTGPPLRTSSLPRPKRPIHVGNPDWMISPTLGDVIHDATAGQGKVFGLSLKDRSALLPVGKRPDGAYWFTGKFVTSTYYRDTPHTWVDSFNKSGRAEEWFGKKWDRLRPDLDYAARSGPDDVKGEGNVNAQGRTFPHPTDGGKKQVGSEYYNALANSPFGNDLLLEFAKTCIVAENLGRDDVPDLLTISFSSNDLIGHCWGPDSQEVLDVTLRSDRTMAELMKFLDTRVGAGKYVVAVTADHGICPLPEVAAAKGLGGKRVNPTSLILGAEAHLRKTFGTPRGAAEPTSIKPDEPEGWSGLWIEKVAVPWVYLNRNQVAARGLDIRDVAASLAEWFNAQPDVHRAYTPSDLFSPSADPMTERVRRSFHRSRSGNVYVVLKPYHLASDPIKATGTNHGTPHAYDTHVPLLVYGPGVAGGRRPEPVTPQHAAPILAHFLGLPPPADNEYELPTTLFAPEAPK